MILREPSDPKFKVMGLVDVSTIIKMLAYGNIWEFGRMTTFMVFQRNKHS